MALWSVYRSLTVCFPWQRVLALVQAVQEDRLGGVKGYAIILLLLLPHSSLFPVLSTEQDYTGEPLHVLSMVIAPRLRGAPGQNSSCTDSWCTELALSTWPVLHLMPFPPCQPCRKPQKEFPERLDQFYALFGCLFSAACSGLKGRA